VDETYVKVAGRWRYIYRAIDPFGQVVDVFVAPRRDAKEAHDSSSGRWARTKVTPVGVTTDKAPVYPAVLEELLPAAWHRAEQYANNRVECDPGQAEGAAAADAWPQTGPVCQRDHRRPRLGAGPSARTLRTGG
jgi:IS6 family transposase